MKQSGRKGDGSTTTTGRLRVKPAAEVRPFQAKMPEPIAGESLLGFVTRCLSLTPAKQTVQGLGLAGIGRLQPFSLPTTLKNERQIEGLATLLQTTPDRITERLHRPGTLNRGKSEAIDFFGVMIRADYREKTIRRVSPRALDISLHHRAIWDLRIFSFDPQTKETLLDTCPQCGTRPGANHKLGWMRSRGVYKCDRCVDARGLANVDLRDYPQPLVEVDDMEALDFVTGLVDPDPARRDAARRLVPSPWSDLGQSELFETAVAFACALTQKPDAARNTLERPKDVPEYARFTPEILAAAGRAIIGGEAGFTAVADCIRADAPKRPGFYGVKKELMPLFCMTVDQHLSRGVKAIVRSAVEADMKRTKNDVALRRADYAGDERYLSIDALAEETDLPRKNLGWLADSGRIPVVTAKDAVRAPVMMVLADVMPLVPVFLDSLHETFAAGQLAVKTEVLDDLEARKLIERIEGPVLGLFETQARYYRKSSVERLAARILERAEAGGPTPPAPGGMRISKAVKRLGMTPVPWVAVIAAIASGAAPVCVHPGDNKNWLTGVGVGNVRGFVRAVLAEAGEANLATLDEFIGNQTTAEILGITEVMVYLLAKPSQGRKTPYLKRKGPSALKNFARADVEAFAREYIFVPEIQNRTGVRRARDVRQWLAARGVTEAFELTEGRYLGFKRAKVEEVLEREAAQARIAAE